MPKYLTKSRFKLGLECPTKLFYNIHTNIYHDEKLDNDFLQALAKGGFQVGELAKLYYKELTNTPWFDIDTLDETVAVERTESALLEEEVVIFEAAIRVGFKYIRVDILHKTKNVIRILEVKSKSGKGKDPSQFFGASGGVDSKWRPYLEDIVFQKIVMEEYLEEKEFNMPVRAFLMVPDKLKKASIDGLHQKFVLVENNGRHECQPLSGLTKEDLGDKILSEIPVSDATARILMNDEKYSGNEYPVRGFKNIIDHFEQLVEYYNGNTDEIDVEYAAPGRKCKECTFRTKGNDPTEEGKLSGFRQCMETQLSWDFHQVNKPKVYDVWDFRSSEVVINGGRWFMDELNMSDFDTNGEICTDPDMGNGLTNVQRRWLQVDRTNNGEDEYVDIEYLRSKMNECQPPYHFIDFETIGPAIPFFKDYRPFQGFAFQFSHHMLHEDGTLEHKTEYLGEGQGINPFDDFILNLYEALRHDDGTIFMFSSHENTFVNNAIVYLLNGQSRFDDDMVNTLNEFYQSISKPTGENSKKDFAWQKGERMMVDLCEMVKRTYWHPFMGGSNSIKKVLPAVLNSSEYLQQKYSQPIYGREGIPSNNFTGMRWVEYVEDGMVKDPYKLLPDLEDIFDEDMQEIDVLLADEKIGNGGAAMTAWSYMQFVQMSEVERRAIIDALKMYCELDTLAMVFIWEYFQSLSAS